MRREDWPEKLIETVERHAALPFSWGHSDCWTLPIDCAVAMGLPDPWPAVRGKYSTEKGAAGKLRKRGWTSVADAFAAFYEEVPSAMAQRGDIGVVAGQRGLAGAVFVDTDAVTKPLGGGIQRVARSQVLRAFRVV